MKDNYNILASFDGNVNYRVNAMWSIIDRIICGRSNFHDLSELFELEFRSSNLFELRVTPSRFRFERTLLYDGALFHLLEEHLAQYMDHLVDKINHENIL